MQKFPLSIIFVIIVSFIFSQALVNNSLLYLGLFTILVIVPFFTVFRNIYFFSFLVLRASFDIIEKYRTLPLNLNVPLTMLLVAIYWLVLILNKEYLGVILGNRFLRRFNFLFSLFLASTLISSFVSNSPFMISFPDFARLASLLLLINYAVVYSFQNAGGVKRVIYLILFSSIIPELLGLYQWIGRHGLKIEGVNRVFGSFVHPNVFAEYLIVIFFLLVFLAFSPESTRRLKKWTRLYLFITAVSIFNTFTRNVWIALLISSAVLISFGKPLSKKLKNLFIGALFLILLIPVIYSRIMDLANPVSGMSSWEWRMILWRKTFDSVLERPFFGHGLGMFQQENAVMAHNDYLRLSFEVGFIGLFLYLLVLAMVLIFSFKKASNKNYSLPQRREGLIVFCLILCFLIIGVADNLARSTVVLNYAFVSTAVLLAGGGSGLKTSNENTYRK